MKLSEGYSEREEGLFLALVIIQLGAHCHGILQTSGLKGVQKQLHKAM